MRRRLWIWTLVVLASLATCNGWRLARLSPLQLFDVPAAPPGRSTLSPPEPVVPRDRSGRPFPHRLANTTLTVGQLARSDHAILLRNALLDTSRPLDLPIPDALRAGPDPGSYIVESRSPLDHTFRALLERSGAAFVSYIPNQAALVRASATAIQRVAAAPQVRAVVPYHPYFKLDPALLDLLAGASPSGASPALSLTVLLFADARDSSFRALSSLNTRIVAEESTPFGPALELLARAPDLAALAGLPGVQEIEPAHTRIAANDLTRVALGVAPDLTAPANYLGLSGTNIVVNVNDLGFDTNQPDLQGRIVLDGSATGTDTNGHGTFVAGMIAGNGSQFLTISNVPGSGAVPADRHIRGVAPAATLFAIPLSATPSFGDDTYLQRAAVTNNAFISNNSWNYSGDVQYDLAAASFDAATRDALPAASGSQPLLFVFAAGNAGRGADDGSGGVPGSILSPGTAKNVLTIGALEHPRFITNQTWTCAGDCVTNTPWLGMTDSTNQVAAFSSRGNVGIGVEGDFGRFKPDLVAPGCFILSTRSAQWDQSAYYAQTNDWFGQVPDTNYADVLSNLNGSVGPYYRFESGTSLAAASVSGTLALMQEFFGQRLGRTTSPALMKALLINGAQPLANLYHPRIADVTNFEGWGAVNLPHSLPVTLTNLNSVTNGIFVFDQDPASALGTGQSQTRYLSLSPVAQAQPLRFTLVWTDPPGNPITSIKLVNNLDLVVTNLDTGDVYFGNDFLAGSDFNAVWNKNTAPNLDYVNNVENVFLPASLGTDFSVTVLGRQVNVNAVSGQAGAVLQDYALVITSGEGQDPQALVLSNSLVVTSPPAWSSVLTNSFLFDSNNSGAIALRQRIGAGTPSLATNTVPLPLFANASLTIGDSNQWRFYVITNDQDFTNAAFFTFAARTLAAGGVSTVSPLAPDPANATRAEADIDLYVSTDPTLTNLNPATIEAADKSLSRGSAETIIYSNAAAVYYVGVKSESQDAAEFSLGAVFSALPFAELDAQNNQILRGFPVPVEIPGGTAAVPGAASVFSLAPNSAMVRRVIVTNTLSAPALGDVQGTLTHDNRSVVLDNFSTNGPVFSQPFVYDDSGEGDITGGQPPDGPGFLRQFAGQDAFGQWRLDLLDTNRPATDENLSVFLEAQPDLTAGTIVSVLPGVCRQDYLYLPLAVTNVTLAASLNSGSGPVSVQLCPANYPLSGCPSLLLPTNSGSGAMTVDATSHPPITPGLYVVRSCNQGPDPASLNLFTSLGIAPNLPPARRFQGTGVAPIPDDAVSTSTILVTNTDPVLSASVGVRIDHPRVSDLALSLVSPNGTRVLLDENRGGDSTNGLGFDMVVTNNTPVSFSGGPEAVTNTFDIGRNTGTILINYDFYALPDDMRVYYEGNLLFDSGLVSDTGSANLTFGPGTSTIITVVMNEGGNLNSNTAWFYQLTSIHLQPIYFTFTENTNLTTTPVKFASVPFTNITYTGPPTPAGGIFYLPEESLDRVAGQSAAGPWTLEIADARAGATDPPPALLSWDLMLHFKNVVPPPVGLAPGSGWTNLLGSGQIQWFSVATPPWISFATNSLLFASVPVNLFFNQAAPPTGTNAGDLLLLHGATADTTVLTTNSTPPLLPGAVYYLGVQNTNSATVSFAVTVNFDVPTVVTLTNGVPFPNVNNGPLGSTDYYLYVVSTNAVRAQFEVDAPSADVALLARKGLPLPSLSNRDYLSDNPGTNEELIVLFNYSTPVPLSPGEWYLAVINTNGGPTSYTVTATEFPVYGTNILIASETATPTNFCLTWTSLPGVHYFVQGKAVLTDTNWTKTSPTVVATDFSTTYCVPLPSEFYFFRVAEGTVLGFPPATITSVVSATNGISLQWSALTNNQFRVQWSPSLAPPSWQAFTNLITSTNGSFSFFDDGTQTGGLGSVRFYRLSQLPPP